MSTHDIADSTTAKLAKDIDERGRFIVLQKESETTIGLLFDGQRIFGRDVLNICLRAGLYMVRNRQLAALAIEFRDLWDIIGRDVVVSDPHKLARLDEFVAEFRRLRGQL